MDRPKKDVRQGVQIKQRDITDCGAACLASISNHYGLKVPVSKIRRLAGTDKKGTNALGLIEAAEKLGYSAKGVRGETPVLRDIPTPTIAHVVINDALQHYVVIYKTSTTKVKVMDPGVGKMESYTIQEFEKIWTGVLILLAPNENFQRGNQTISMNSRFWFLLKPHGPLLIQCVLGAGIFTLIGLTSAIYVQKIIDFVLPSHNSNLLNLMSVLMLTLLTVQLAVNVFKSIFILKVGQQLDAKLILGYYKHLLTLPQQFFDTMRVGELISRVNDAVKIRYFLNEACIEILINCLVVIFSFGLMFTYYWKLALVVLIVIPIYSLIYYLSNYFNRHVERRVMESTAELESQLVESLSGIKAIKSFGVTDFVNLKTEMSFVGLLTGVYKSGINSIFSTNSSFATSRLFTIILLWVGAGFVIDQKITPGELMSFYAIIGYLTGPATSLIDSNKIYQNARIAADRLFEVMDLQGHSDEGKLEMQRDEIGDVRLVGVKFRYGTRSSVFEGLNLTIKKGQLTSIVGASGSGKSTIASILKGLYPLESGKVLVGKYNLSNINEHSLSRLVGIVPQHVDLFAGSVLENIALGEFQPDTQRILRLSEDIDAIGFINELPGGLSCQLGQNGMDLSGGQRQRLAILRALYPDPEIIIFDEAMSALDRKSEDVILALMLKLRSQGKTIISITHRLKAAMIADKVVLFDQGSIISEGPHSQLINDDHKYKEFWKQASAPSYQ